MFARGLFVGVVAAVVALGVWAFAAGTEFVPMFSRLTTFGMGKSCKMDDAGTNKIECRVKVTVKSAGCPASASDIEFVPDGLKLNGDSKVILVWELTNAEYHFCPARGDGVIFKPGTNTRGQFDRNFATDDRDGGYPYATTECYKYYRWRDKNDSNTYHSDFPYRIVFGPSDVTKPACAWDPFIRNG